MPFDRHAARVAARANPYTGVMPERVASLPAPANLPAGWQMLGPDDGLPAWGAWSDPIKGMSAAVPLYDNGGDIWCLRPNSSGTLEGVTTVGWEDADWQAASDAWYNESTNDQGHEFSFNFPTHQGDSKYLDVGGQVRGNGGGQSGVVKSINSSGVPTVSHDSGVAFMVFSVAIKYVAPKSIYVNEYAQENYEGVRHPQQDTLVWSGVIQPDGTPIDIYDEVEVIHPGDYYPHEELYEQSEFGMVHHGAHYILNGADDDMSFTRVKAGTPYAGRLVSTWFSPIGARIIGADLPAHLASEYKKLGGAARSMNWEVLAIGIFIMLLSMMVVVVPATASPAGARYSYIAGKVIGLVGTIVALVGLIGKVYK